MQPMEILPYSIYVDHRPVRVAFLVDPNGDKEWFEAILEYNKDKWGGKFNPIILCDGKELTSEWWDFLREYDPDIIQSTVSLEEDLLKKLHTFLTPYSIQQYSGEGHYVRADNDYISILPTQQNISWVGRDMFDTKSNLVIFEFDETTPVEIKEFLGRNFGILENNQMTCYPIKKCLEGCNTKTYKITNLESLNEALLEWGEFHTKVVFPIQICSLPNTFKDVEYGGDDEKFAVVVGDSFDEFAYFWNRTLSIHDWMRTGITQLLLTKAFAENEILRPGLGKFINKFTGQTGNNNSHGMRFVSFSLEETEIKSISDLFNGSTWHPKTFAKFNSPQVPKFSDYSSMMYLKKGLEFYRANSNEEHILINEPDVKEGMMGGEYWVADVYIQFRPERFTNIIGKDYWWQLPRRNSLSNDLRIFNKPTRINSAGSFSIILRRRSGFFPEENKVVIKIPDDNDVFHGLLCGEGYSFVGKDQRERFLSRPFYAVRKSDKGKYFLGVINLFPDFLNAHHFIQERYWRRMFEIMSNKGKSKDEESKRNIYNLLKKNIDSEHDFKKEEDLSWLSEHVLQLTKTSAKQEIDLKITRFIDEAKKETEEYNNKEKQNKFEFYENDLKEKISELLELNILLVGVKPKCPHCGYRIWYHINEIRQAINCRGCGYEYNIQAEEPWQYRLNSLVRSAFGSHGTLPVLLVIGQLMFEARNSFIYSPSLDLLSKPETGDKLIHYGEVDLVCVKDGKFIIGEIKQSVSLFKKSDFDKMLELAKKIKPDTIIFSSLDREPSQSVKSNIDRIKEELKDLEVEVVWYPIDSWAFEPSPVR